MVKIYAIRFMSNSTNKGEEKTELYSDNKIGDFIERVKFLKENPYVENVKVYSGVLEEIDLEKVINPF